MRPARHVVLGTCTVNNMPENASISRRMLVSRPCTARYAGAGGPCHEPQFQLNSAVCNPPACRPTCNPWLDPLGLARPARSRLVIPDSHPALSALPEDQPSVSVSCVSDKSTAPSSIRESVNTLTLDPATPPSHTGAPGTIPCLAASTPPSRTADANSPPRRIPLSASDRPSLDGTRNVPRNGRPSRTWHLRRGKWQEEARQNSPANPDAPPR